MTPRVVGVGLMVTAVADALTRPMPDGAPCCARLAGVLKLDSWRGWSFVAGFALVLWSSRR